MVGEDFDSTFDYQKLGANANDLKTVLSGTWGKKLASAKRPMIIVGSGVTEHSDAKNIYETVGAFVLLRELSLKAVHALVLLSELLSHPLKLRGHVVVA